MKEAFALAERLLETQKHRTRELLMDKDSPPPASQK